MGTEYNSKAILERLSSESRKRFYNVFDSIEWPESLGEDQPWMPMRLLSIYGTPYFEAMPEAQRIRLGKWETVNLFSVFIVGERDLCAVVMQNWFREEFREYAEYFHHFLDEENKHMWFFREFCLRYAGKTYANKKIFLEDKEEPLIRSFKDFAKILIFESMGDFFNTSVGRDAHVHPVIRRIHSLHHADEVRHMQMGRLICRDALGMLTDRFGKEMAASVEAYLRRFCRWCVANLYNPSVYGDAGMENGYRVYNALLASPQRAIEEAKIMESSHRFLDALFGKEKA